METRAVDLQAMSKLPIELALAKDQYKRYVFTDGKCLKCRAKLTGFVCANCGADYENKKFESNLDMTEISVLKI